MARSKKLSEFDEETSAMPKVGPSHGAPWYLYSLSGDLLAYSPFSDAASQTARAIWGNVELHLSGDNFDVFLGKKLVGKIVKRR